jgi:hypothetical protein
MKRSSSFRFMLLGAVMVLMLLPTMSCTSSRGCPENPEPVIKIKEVPMPYPVLLKIKLLPPLELPEYPMAPSHDADEAEWKTFALEVERVAKEREARRAARIEALEEQINRHNSLETSDPPIPIP